MYKIWARYWIQKTPTNFCKISKNSSNSADRSWRANRTKKKCEKYVSSILPKIQVALKAERHRSEHGHLLIQKMVPKAVKVNKKANQHADRKDDHKNQMSK